MGSGRSIVSSNGRRLAGTADMSGPLRRLSMASTSEPAHVDILALGDGEDDQSEAVDVAPRADLAAIIAELLGRDIVQFAGEAVADDRRRAGVEILGDAEIDDLGLVDVAAGKQDVVGRHVAVDGAEPVGGGEARGEPLEQAGQLLGRTLDLAEHVGELDALDEFGDDVERAQLRLLGEDAVGDERLVLELGEGARLLAEHGDDLLVGRHAPAASP